MIEFIEQYWIEVLFGLIVAGFGVFFKKFWDMIKAENKRTLEDMLNRIDQKSKDDDEKLRLEMKILKENMDEQIKALKKGVLSMQRRDFKADCTKLLDPSHTITLKEYRDIEDDHDCYNALGGNHDGDKLFALVVEKARATLITPANNDDDDE